MLGSIYIYINHNSIPLASDNSILVYQSSPPAILQCARISKIPTGQCHSAKDWATSLQHISRCSRQTVWLPVYPNSKGVGKRPEGKKGRHRWSGSAPGLQEVPALTWVLCPSPRCNAHVRREKGPAGVSPPDALQDLTDTSLHLSFDGDMQSSPTTSFSLQPTGCFHVLCIVFAPVRSQIWLSLTSPKPASQFRWKSMQPSKVTASGHQQQQHRTRAQAFMSMWRLCPLKGLSFCGFPCSHLYSCRQKSVL